MGDIQSKATQLADLMAEFNLREAEVAGEGWGIAFRKRSASDVVAVSSDAGSATHSAAPAAIEPEKPAAQGIPVTSPMTGIYYSASSPSSPPFVQEGDTVEVGQVVALIEAMKVFNEITATVSGRVLQMVVENGALVNPGEPLLYIG